VVPAWTVTQHHRQVSLMARAVWVQFISHSHLEVCSQTSWRYLVWLGWVPTTFPTYIGFFMSCCDMRIHLVLKGEEVNYGMKRR
jgi:hypothetical protein